MTDKELRDAAVAELKLTEVGWLKKSGGQWVPRYPSGPPAGTHWRAAMDSLAQIGAVPVPPPEPEPEPEPTPVGKSYGLPAKFQVWAATQQKLSEVDWAIASFTSDSDPRIARQTNPGLIATAGNSLDPFNADWRSRRASGWTYGAFGNWSGGNDSLAPNPQGALRGWASTDWGCTQTDGLPGFALNRPLTAELVGKLVFYTWKLGKGKERGFQGVWTDNLFSGESLDAGWAYGACGATVDASQWEAGIRKITQVVRAGMGEPTYLGGNMHYLTVDSASRAAINMTLRETYYHHTAGCIANQSVDRIWQDVQAMQAWFSVPSVDGLPKIAALTCQYPRSQPAAFQKHMLAMALIYGCSYNSYDAGHHDTFWPPEITRNGQRGYLGQPSAPATRSGNVLSRRFKTPDGVERIVTADPVARTATIA